MTKRHGRLVVGTLAVLFCCADSAAFPLRAGDYGDATLPCDQQPNAGIVTFDGRDFAYPHATRCRDIVQARSGTLLTIRETCRANGDGSPAKPTTQTLRLRIARADRFATLGNGHAATFRRCGPPGWFDRH